MKNIFSDWFSLAILTSIVWGFVPLLEKYGMAKVDSATGLFFRCAGASIGIFLAALYSPTAIKAGAQAGTKVLLALVVAGFLGSVVGQILNLSAIKSGEVTKVTPITASWPLFTFILGVLFLNESITLTKLIAVASILTGIILLKI